MNVQKYLEQAKKRSMESFNGADGFMDDVSFAGDDFFAGANGPQNGQGITVPKSQPYIVTITSTSGAAVSNFEILGSYEYINNSGFTAAGDLVIGAITISSGIANITYREMLYQFMNNPFSVGLTYIQSATANQILETYSVNTRDANGNTAQKALVPTIDPYQNQATVLAMQYGYKIDGFTKIIIRNILANATVKINIYPSDNINLARGLNGQQVSRQYGNPNVVKSQTVKLS
jgi:hypothetical protein